MTATKINKLFTKSPEKQPFKRKATKTTVNLQTSGQKTRFNISTPPTKLPPTETNKHSHAKQASNKPSATVYESNQNGPPDATEVISTSVSTIQQSDESSPPKDVNRSNSEMEVTNTSNTHPVREQGESLPDKSTSEAGSDQTNPHPGSEPKQTNKLED